MPGLVGLAQETTRESASDLLARMARALEPDFRFRARLHAESEFGLGRVSLELLDSTPQPVWNEDRTIALVMEGEIYGAEDLAPGLREKGHQLEIGNDAELLLHLYEEAGDDFASSLNGAFVVALWDRHSHKLLVTNDRLGLVPLYYARTREGILFASGVRALLADPSLPRQVDHTAIAEFLTFDHVLGERTLLSAAKLLPQGAVLTFKDGSLHIRRHWKPEFPGTYPVFREADYVEEATFLLRQAVARVARREGRVGVLLSGGLDSRMLLAVLTSLPGQNPPVAITWGIPGCDDARFAREAARVAGAPFEFLELPSDWLVNEAGNAVRITDGMGNLVNLHALAVVRRARGYVDVLYKGFLGDAMFGYGITRRYWADYDEATAFHVHLEAYRDYRVLTFDLPEHPRLFSEGFRAEVGDGVEEDYRSAMGASGARQLADQRIYIDMTQRVPRMTLNGVEVARDQVIVRLPYCDKDLVEFSLRIPPGLRPGRQVIVRTFIESFPALAQVPFTPFGLPLMSCAGDLVARGRQMAQWHLRRIGLEKLAGPERRPAQDYAAWLRTSLRPWVEDTLLTARSLDRGYFQPEYIRRVVQDHMCGVNHAVRIGALLSIELWHRQCLD